MVFDNLAQIERLKGSGGDLEWIFEFSFNSMKKRCQPEMEQTAAFATKLIELRLEMKSVCSTDTCVDTASSSVDFGSEYIQDHWWNKADQALKYLD